MTMGGILPAVLRLRSAGHADDQQNDKAERYQQMLVFLIIERPISSWRFVAQKRPSPHRYQPMHRSGDV